MSNSITKVILVCPDKTIIFKVAYQQIPVIVNEVTTWMMAVVPGRLVGRMVAITASDIASTYNNDIFNICDRELFINLGGIYGLPDYSYCWKPAGRGARVMYVSKGRCRN